MHEDLVVARKGIHETKQLIPRGGVNQCINAWEREAVFGTGFVEVGKVHAHPSFTVGFLYQDYIGQPVGVMDLLDELHL
jgi:hypothetical protein